MFQDDHGSGKHEVWSLLPIHPGNESAMATFVQIEKSLCNGNFL